MSLENQIANLVGAANSLTSQVAGKMNQIDLKVRAATDSVPNVIRELSSIEFYVNYSEGEDSSSADGSSSRPFKTIIYAASRAIPGSRARIVLAGDADHICEVPENKSHHNSFHNKIIEIAGEPGRWETSPSVIRCRATPWVSGNLSRCNIFEGSDLKLSFYECRMIMENNTGLDLYGEGFSNGYSFGGLFTRGTVSAGYTNFDIHFSKVRLHADGNVKLVTGYSGRVGVFVRDFQLFGSEYAPLPLISGRNALTLQVGNSSISGFENNEASAVFGFENAAAAKLIFL